MTRFRYGCWKTYVKRSKRISHNKSGISKHAQRRRDKPRVMRPQIQNIDRQAANACKVRERCLVVVTGMATLFVWPFFQSEHNIPAQTFLAQLIIGGRGGFVAAAVRYVTGTDRSKSNITWPETIVTYGLGVLICRSWVPVRLGTRIRVRADRRGLRISISVLAGSGRNHSWPTQRQLSSCRCSLKTLLPAFAAQQ